MAKKRKLKSLENHNRDKLAANKARLRLQTNGIACPDCGEELVDSLPRVAIKELRQYAVQCLKCEYHGFRY